jgi:arginyl-tRNA synthetase
MKYETLTSVIRKHIKSALQKNIGELSESTIELKKIKIGVERTRSAAFGDFSSNVAMSLGLSASATMSLAHTICKSLPKKIFAKCEVVKPGFINMTLTIDTINKVLIDIFKQKSSYGKFACKKDVFNIEFVSANPTGLLHIGHARNAAYGDTLANI